MIAYLVCYIRWERSIWSRRRDEYVLHRIYCNACGTGGELYEKDVLLGWTYCKFQVTGGIGMRREVYREVCIAVGFTAGPS